MPFELAADEKIVKKKEKPEEGAHHNAFECTVASPPDDERESRKGEPLTG